MMYKFDCGCEIPIVDNNIKDIDGLPSILIDYDNLPHCPIVWELFHGGKTKGIFQLENKLGQDWSKKIKPNDLDELSAVISVIRPGTLKSKLDGTSLTQHFADRKSGKEEVSYIHPLLEPILRKTQGILVYQEQAMRIATDLAGFNLQEADTLRKAIGKKLADVMTQVEKMFMEKSRTFGKIDDNTATQIFGWIRESQKYSFNKSHGVGYADIGYKCAYVKAHFPIHFYTSWLYYAKDKQFSQEEIELLIEDALSNGINVYPPTFKYGLSVDSTHFFTKNNAIHFGLSDVKQVGESISRKIVEAVKVAESDSGKKIGDWTWYEFLIFMGDEISSRAMNNLIAVGAMDYLSSGMSRAAKLFEYNIYSQLDTKEKAYIKYIGKTNLKDAIQEILIDSRLKRTVNRKEKLLVLKESLAAAPYSTKDSRYTIIKAEQELLGIPISCARTDECSVYGDSMCVDLQFKKGNTSIAVEILNVREHIIKSGNSKGKKMAFLKVKDQSGIFDSVVIFSEKYEEYAAFIFKGNTLLLKGVLSEKNEQKSFVVNEVTQI